MDIILITSVISSLFLVIAIAEPLANRLRLSYTALLAIVGILIGSGAAFFLNTELTNALNPVAEAILGLPIHANVFLYVFLPTLLFQATLGMNLRRMLDDWVPILVMAVVAVVVATFSVGYALLWASPLPLTACLLIGAIVSTTDPSAVVSIFRSIAAPKRLARIIEGESLLNDAAAIALFGVFLTYVSVNVPDPTVSGALARFPVLIIGGALTGWVATRMALWLMSLLVHYDRAIISVSVALPYMAYIIAEQTIGASGVIAVVTAGLTLKLAGPSRIPPISWAYLIETWGLLAHWAGALIFILAALLIPRMLESVRAHDVLLILVVIAAAMASRAFILFGLLPFLSSLRLSPKIETPYKVSILWGGLRGALTLALALAVTESAAVPDDIKRLVGILATGFTLFTLLVQGTTLRRVISLLKLDRLSPLDQALSNQVVAVALQTIREDMSTQIKHFDLPHEVVRSEANRLSMRVDAAVHLAEDNKDIGDRDRINLGLIALAVAERNAILERLRERTFPLRIAERAIADADRLIDGSRATGRIGYQHTAKTNIAFTHDYQLALFAHNYLMWSSPLTRIVQERFEVLVSQRVILADLEGFINARIKSLHGKRAADLLHELLVRRKATVVAALEGLRLQFPGYAEELGRSLIQRTELRLEEREYESLRAQSLIGSELYTTLVQDITSRRTLAEQKQELDIAAQGIELIRQYPLFADLDNETLKTLVRNMEARYVDSNTVIANNDQIDKKLYFIVSGVVETDIDGQVTQHSTGEMFGAIKHTAGSRQQTRICTIEPSTLLVLDEARFQRLLKRLPKLQHMMNDAHGKHKLA